jgi:hypothetical protein
MGQRRNLASRVETGEVDRSVPRVSGYSSRLIGGGCGDRSLHCPPLRFRASMARNALCRPPTGRARFRANNGAGAVMRLPQPRLVQTRLSALSRLQCGQIVFSNDITSSISERHHAIVRFEKEYPEGEKRTVVGGILYWDFQRPSRSRNRG